jgi:hypothetical protein
MEHADTGFIPSVSVKLSTHPCKVAQMSEFHKDLSHTDPGFPTRVDEDT